MMATLIGFSGAMGYPVLLATSRKSMIGNVLNLHVEERLEGTSATVVYELKWFLSYDKISLCKGNGAGNLLTYVLVG